MKGSRFFLLFALILSCSNKSAYSQNNGQDLVLSATTVFSALGVAYVTQRASMLGEKPVDLTTSEILEAKDELLQYEAEDQSELYEREFRNKYPALARYLINLSKENPEFRGLLREELIEIANYRLLNKRTNE